MGKGLNKVFKTVVKELSQDLLLAEYGSEISHIIPEPRNLDEVTKLPDDIEKHWLKATQNDIKNLISNQAFLVEDPEKDEPVTPCLDMYKAKIQPDGSLDKLKWINVVRRDMQNKESVGNTWLSTASMRSLNYFLADAAKHKERVHQLYFIRALLQAKVKNILFVKLDSIYADYFPEYANYFGRSLRLLNYM